MTALLRLLPGAAVPAPEAPPAWLPEPVWRAHRAAFAIPVEGLPHSVSALALMREDGGWVDLFLHAAGGETVGCTLEAPAAGWRVTGSGLPSDRAWPGSPPGWRSIPQMPGALPCRLELPPGEPRLLRLGLLSA